MAEALHSLLERQLRHARDRDGQLGVAALLKLIDTAYREQDRAIRLADRAMNLASAELAEVNGQLRIEAENHLAARNAAEAANTAKSAFLANMSHELRTPLTAIIGYSEMIAEESSDDQARKDAQSIHAAARHLLSLINEVLDLAKVESGKMTVHTERTDIDVLLDGLMDTARPLAASNANRLTLDRPAPIGIVETDEIKLRQCLLNLLSNACKFTKDGAITLSASRHAGATGETLVFTVADTGPGIPLEKQRDLFQPFVQTQAHQSGGTGLGLALTKRFCALLGGTVALDSAEGAGARFTIELPAAPLVA
jgi:signal transduction histidine kinase